jgi:hypothetical protein
LVGKLGDSIVPNQLPFTSGIGADDEGGVVKGGGAGVGVGDTGVGVGAGDPDEPPLLPQLVVRDAPTSSVAARNANFADRRRTKGQFYLLPNPTTSPAPTRTSLLFF